MSDLWNLTEWQRRQLREAQAAAKTAAMTKAERERRALDYCCPVCGARRPDLSAFAVYHKDGDPDNNDLPNLELRPMPQGGESGD